MLSFSTAPGCLLKAFACPIPFGVHFSFSLQVAVVCLPICPLQVLSHFFRQHLLVILLVFTM